MDYFIVDVFCLDKYSGNQLAVVIPDKEITSKLMQETASEFHFSETTFINKKSDDGYDVRIFTPGREVPFAGHPALGSAYIIGKEILKEFPERIVLNLKAGKIPVTMDDGILRMRQNAPEFGRIFNGEEVSKIISLDPDKIDMNYPVQEVSTGMPFIIIPLKKLSGIKKAVTNIPAYNEFFRTCGTDPRPLFLFCPETYEKSNLINCRMFADIFGIPEDPATGSANGCLAGYLVKYDYFRKGDLDIKVEQGYEIGRKSLLHLKAKKRNGEIEVNVGGRVIEIAKGTLF
jgi:trans-2,3-dihydro-3-hydroxyanthranilate isomerase